MNVTLPENKRREITTVKKHKLWIYGQPFSGKTTLADKFPNPFILNTDGNTKYVTAPDVLIADKVETNGRLVDTTLAWELFKAYVDKLAEKNNTFETIVVDLIEDMYEYCRQYIYKEMGITHESDDSFRAWDKVRTEFLTVIKKLINLDYENIILISHEDVSRDITKRTGDKITAIKPNINDKTALKLAGMVDVVIRAVAEDDVYKLTFKSDEVVFGGGRIKLNVKEIPNDYKALINVLEGGSFRNSNNNVNSVSKDDNPKTEKLSRPDYGDASTPAPVETVETVSSAEDVSSGPKEEAPRRRRRRSE